MSDKDLNNNEEHLERQEREGFDYTLKDKADEIGIIAKGSAANSGSTTLNDKKKEEKKFQDALLKLILDTPEKVAKALEEAGEKKKSAESHIDNARSFKNALENGDFAELAILLKQQGYDAEGLSQDEMKQLGTAAMMDEYALAQQDINFAKPIYEKVKSSTGATEDQRNEANDAMQQISEWEQEIANAKKEYGINNDNITIKDTSLRMDEYDAYNDLGMTDKSETSDPFAEVATSNVNPVTDDPFAQVADKTLTTSFAKSVGADNPFTEKAGNISDPFNDVANQVLAEQKPEIEMDAETKATPTVNSGIPSI